MKTKLVLWGHTADDQKTLIALQLKPETNQVDIWAFPESVVTEEFYNQLMKEWRKGKKVDFPESNTHYEKQLTVSEDLLPDALKADKKDLITRAQTEWHFVVLSTKLNEAYQAELQDLKEKIEQLTAYDNLRWNELKGFWSKVQEQVRERNLFRDHANSLKETINNLFARLKELRSSLDAEFQATAETNYNKLNATLQEIQNKIEQGNTLHNAFEELKKLQKQFRDAKLTRELRSKIWEQLDKAFKAVKVKRFGSVDSSSVEVRLQRRYNGLLNAIKKMDQSITRDKQDLQFQKRKMDDSGAGQLEMQIRDAKIKMIESRVSSKQEKLTDMNKTKVELEERIATNKAKASKKEAQIAKTTTKKSTLLPTAEVVEQVSQETEIEAAVEKVVEETLSTETEIEAAVEKVIEETPSTETEIEATVEKVIEETPSTETESIVQQEISESKEIIDNTVGSTVDEMLEISSDNNIEDIDTTDDHQT